MAAKKKKTGEPAVYRAVVFKGGGLQPWRFRLVAPNGEAVAQSEGYVTRWNARRAARKAFGPTVPVE